MNTMFTRIRNSGIIPVVVLESESDAVRVAKALRSGGIYCAEITFRTAAAAAAIRKIKEVFPDMLIGAGTILTEQQVEEAVSAGAEFLVSPGFDPNIVNFCLKKEILMIPGISGPTELEQAYVKGLKLVKFFPAEAAGGVAMIKSMSGPFPDMMFMPTGGIDNGNVNQYLELSKVLACGGSWMVSEKLIRGRNFEEISRLSREAVNHMLGFCLEHVGVHTKTEEEAIQAADNFCRLLELVRRDESKSIFAGNVIEVMKGSGRGERGHIAIGTKDVERAKYFLEKRGIEFDEETAEYKDGYMTLIYLKESVTGFSLHLKKVNQEAGYGK